MSRLQQSVLGDEPLHALPFQKLNGSPVDLAAVPWLSQRSQLLLDVLQPQIYRGGECSFQTSQVCLMLSDKQIGRTVILNQTTSLELLI